MAMEIYRPSRDKILEWFQEESLDPMKILFWKQTIYIIKSNPFCLRGRYEFYINCFGKTFNFEFFTEALRVIKSNYEDKWHLDLADEYKLFKKQIEDYKK